MDRRNDECRCYRLLVVNRYLGNDASDRFYLSGPRVPAGGTVRQTIAFRVYLRLNDDLALIKYVFVGGEDLRLALRGTVKAVNGSLFFATL